MCCFCDGGITFVILSEACLLLVPGRQSRARRLLNSICSSFTRKHFSMQRAHDFTTLLNKTISALRCVYIFCKRRKKWSALSVWIKADCEASTLKRLNLILSCYICLMVFLISLCHYHLSTYKETKSVLSCHWHFWWWLSKVINTGWPQMMFCTVLKIFTNLLIKENSYYIQISFYLMGMDIFR